MHIHGGEILFKEHGDVDFDMGMMVMVGIVVMVHILLYYINSKDVLLITFYIPFCHFHSQISTFSFILHLMCTIFCPLTFFTTQVGTSIVNGLWYGTDCDVTQMFGICEIEPLNM